MSTTVHTPGPWKVRLNDAEHIGSDELFCPIGGCGCCDSPWVNGNTDEERNANARLIAAAPELATALRELVLDMKIAQANMRDAAKRDPKWEGCAEAIQPRVDAALAALAKAGAA